MLSKRKKVPLLSSVIFYYKSHHHILWIYIDSQFIILGACNEKKYPRFYICSHRGEWCDNSEKGEMQNGWKWRKTAKAPFIKPSATFSVMIWSNKKSTLWGWCRMISLCPSQFFSRWIALGHTGNRNRKTGVQMLNRFMMPACSEIVISAHIVWKSF